MDLQRDLFFSQYALTALFSVANKLQVRGDQYLGEFTIRQMLAISAIIHAPDGKATINHIARKLGTTKQSVKQIVDVMEKKKYLSVMPSERDKRAVNITITAEGEKAFKTCSESTDVFLADIFHDFTTEDLELLCTFLKKLYSFDGVAPESFNEDHPNTSTADEILRHHQNFVKRRTHHHE
ncbi:MarR family winged helix-turn-helix transcriptional regulator [Clostridium sp. Marseille-P2415]|uniref:MarR family winged helix-turn-helix transcriptional regulator n=1 Tax=Clostridium sp. Marseille-P2415 TaxID=1805471 RepID=UPI0009886D2A|nr:MarR family transcriptional regulator [Clostridium sp. Marseille-P2415]